MTAICLLCMMDCIKVDRIAERKAGLYALYLLVEYFATTFLDILYSETPSYFWAGLKQYLEK